MTLEQTGTIMDILKAAYPAFASKQTADDKYQMAQLWAEMFAEDEVMVVAMAVKALIVTKVEGFPPTIGAVKEKIRLITEPPEMTEGEAWALAVRAMKSSDKQKAFAALPPDIQASIGNVRVLKEWGMTDIEQLNTVISSNFMRTFRAKRGHTKEFNALPNDIKAIVGELSAIKRLQDAEIDLLHD